MGSGAHQMDFITVDFVDQQPVRLDMAVAILPPAALQWMVSVLWW